VRERVVFGIMVLLLIVLFSLTFAILGKGEYEPPSPESEGSISAPAKLS
jgi:hypothetical protein